MGTNLNTSVVEWHTPLADLKPPRRIYCIINYRAGVAADKTRETILQAFGAYSSEDEIESIVEICERPKFLPPMVRSAINSGADVIVACGGDGTISTVADQLVGTRVALGVLPFGTLNHFAKDLGIPLDPNEAVEVICRGAIKQVDVGEVNGRHFINNSSLGVYPEAVGMRERWRPIVGKWLALVIGALAVLRRFPVLKLNIEIDDKLVGYRAPLLFVGNNEYSVQWPTLGGRPHLDEGFLSMWLVHQASRLALLRSAFSLLLGQLHIAPELEVSSLQSMTVRARRRRLRVAVDGEVLKLRPPLHYSIRPQALNVCVPSVPEVPSSG